MSKKILFVGADDSNNHDKRVARVFNLTFSNFHEDAESIYQTGKTTSKDFDEWFKKSRSREFRFCFLNNPELSSIQPILPLTIPSLLLSYAPIAKQSPDSLWLAIDGPLPKQQKFFLRRSLERYFPGGVIIKNFVKRNAEMARRPLSQRYESPTILEMAHIKARHIYKNSTHYVGSPREVELNPDYVLDLSSRLKMR